jgi:hypothetical protein
VTLLVFRSIFTNFGPPGTMLINIGAAASNTHKESCASTYSPMFEMPATESWL